MRIYNNIILPYPSRSGIFLTEVGGIKFGLQLNEPIGAPYTVCIYNFSGSSFSQYFCYNNKIGSRWITGISNNPVGTDLQNFILLGDSNRGIFETITPVIGATGCGILHWDGNKVSKEIGLHGYESPYPYNAYILLAINYNNYLTLEPNIKDNNSTLYVGTKK